jgi:hypothetical protein
MTPGTDDSVALLLSLASSAARGEPVAPDAGQWIGEATRRYLDGEGRLDDLLGLRGSAGAWPAPTVHRYKRRNAALRRAAELAHMDMGRLADAVVRFEGTTWPRWRDLPEPPARADALQRALFDAFSAGAPVPTSPRQLRRITVQNDSSAPFD